MAPRPSVSSDAVRRALIVGAIGVVVFAALGWVGLSRGSDGPTSEAPSASIVVGVPGGEVIGTASPSATPEPMPAPTVTADPTTRSTPQPTAEPTAAATPAPATPQPTAAPTPSPTPQPTVTVAALAPDDTVATFYAHVAAGEFDGAYALWSERMRATYPRQEHLDDRFADTASIEFTQLAVVEQGEGGAVVQANFVETYDSGSSREFIGYWELVLVEGRWLLDAPHY